MEDAPMNGVLRIIQKVFPEAFINEDYQFQLSQDGETFRHRTAHLSQALSNGVSPERVALEVIRGFTTEIIRPYEG